MLLTLKSMTEEQTEQDWSLYREITVSLAGHTLKRRLIFLYVIMWVNEKKPKQRDLYI